jgi:predicted ester cyclase
MNAIEHVPDQDVKQLVDGWLRPDLTFVIQVGPIVDADRIALRWRAEGSYAGGLPGAGAPSGTRVDFTGTDVLRVADGRLAEHRVNSDTLLLLTQLQVSA